MATRIRGKLPQNLHKPTQSLLGLSPLFPDELPWNKSSCASLIVIQINCFECGGMATSVCMCHKAGDVLEGSKIESLKSMVSSHNVQNPTRVEVVTALIYKHAVSALGCSFKSTSFNVTVNLRKRMVPPLPDKSVGNMVRWFIVFNPFMEGVETQLHDLVSKMKQEWSKFCDIYVKKLAGKEKDLLFISERLKRATSSATVRSNVENQIVFNFTSWCGFPMYEADFGWGKPIWVTASASPVRNGIILMDARDGKGLSV